MTLYDIQRRNPNTGFWQLGSRMSRGWSLNGAHMAIAHLRTLGDEWLGVYRIVESDTQREVSRVMLERDMAVAS